MKKIAVKRVEMMEVAKEHAARGEEVRIWEKESIHHGRIIWVADGKTPLVMR